MARYENYVYEYGSTIRVHVEQIIDEGEGDHVDIPEGATTAPVGVLKVEYNSNTSGDPVWEELPKNTNVGRLMKSLREQESALAEAEHRAQQAERQLALYEERLLDSEPAVATA